MQGQFCVGDLPDEVVRHYYVKRRYPYVAYTEHRIAQILEKAFEARFLPLHPSHPDSPPSNLRAAVKTALNAVIKPEDLANPFQDKLRIKHKTVEILKAFKRRPKERTLEEVAAVLVVDVQDDPYPERSRPIPTMLTVKAIRETPKLGYGMTLPRDLDELLGKTGSRPRKVDVAPIAWAVDLDDVLGLRARLSAAQAVKAGQVRQKAKTGLIHGGRRSGQTVAADAVWQEWDEQYELQLQLLPRPIAPPLFPLPSALRMAQLGRPALLVTDMGGHPASAAGRKEDLRAALAQSDPSTQSGEIRAQLNIEVALSELSAQDEPYQSSFSTQAKAELLRQCQRSSGAKEHKVARKAEPWERVLLQERLRPLIRDEGERQHVSGTFAPHGLALDRHAVTQHSGGADPSRQFVSTLALDPDAEYSPALSTVEQLVGTSHYVDKLSEAVAIPQMDPAGEEHAWETPHVHSSPRGSYNLEATHPSGPVEEDNRPGPVHAGGPAELWYNEEFNKKNDTVTVQTGTVQLKANHLPPYNGRIAAQLAFEPDLSLEALVKTRAGTEIARRSKRARHADEGDIDDNETEAATDNFDPNRYLVDMVPAKAPLKPRKSRKAIMRDYSVSPDPDAKPPWRTNPLIQNPRWYDRAVALPIDHDKARPNLQVLATIGLMHNIPLISALQHENFELLDEDRPHLAGVDMIISPATGILFCSLLRLTRGYAPLLDQIREAVRSFAQVVVLFEIRSYSAKPHAVGSDDPDPDPLSPAICRALSQFKENIAGLRPDRLGVLTTGKVQVAHTVNGAKEVAGVVRAMADQPDQAFQLPRSEGWLEPSKASPERQLLEVDCSLNPYAARALLAQDPLLDKLYRCEAGCATDLVHYLQPIIGKAMAHRLAHSLTGGVHRQGLIA